MFSGNREYLSFIETVLMSKLRNSNRKSYGGPTNLLVGSSSRYFKDFRRDDVYRKKILQLIEQKVLTSTRYANFRAILIL